MNRPKKITFTLLGIAASVGIATALHQGVGGRIHLQQEAAPQALVLVFDDGCSWRHFRPTREELVLNAFLEVGKRGENPTLGELLQAISLKKSGKAPEPSASPTPAPKKQRLEGYSRVTCDKCGQEYDLSDYEGIYPSEEERKHYHVTPEESGIQKGPEEWALELEVNQ